MNSTLYLLPTPLSEENITELTPPFNIQVIKSCRHFVVEELKTARRFLRAVDRTFPIDDVVFRELNEHTQPGELLEIFTLVTQNQTTVLMSEAGCPGVADPGAALVKMAHARNIKVVPLVGPSSILLAVMAGGLNGQNFAFNGYLPKEKTERGQKIRSLEKLAAQQSQWFIETPYRNTQLLDELLSTLSGNTYLSLAANITAPNEFIKTQTVAEWKQNRPELNKIPCVFGIGRL
jgi:16S rRNA (cytidine1402-2'-O)-methyltransferase